LVEAEKTALYRSDDLGASWERMNTSTSVSARPFYFAYVVVDPVEFDRGRGSRARSRAAGRSGCSW
jgi:hypothetical protein